MLVEEGPVETYAESAQETSQEPELVIGLLASPGPASDLTESLVGEIAERLAGQLPGVRWRVEFVSDRLVEPPTDLSALIAAGRRTLLERGWHLAVCVTDLPLQTARRPVVAHASATHGIAVLSMPALGPVSVRKRAAETIVRLVGQILGDIAPTASADAAGPVAEAVTRRMRELGRRTERDEHGAGFLARVITGNVWLLLGMLRANRPWRLALQLMRALAVAFAAGVFALVTSDIWRLAHYLGPPRLTVIGLGSVAAITVTIMVSTGLWERSPHPAAREQVALFNVVTAATVGLGVAALYLALFIAMLAGALLLVPGNLLSLVLGHPAGVADQVSLAWLATSIATLGGALGAALETSETVREAAYTYQPDTRGLPVRRHRAAEITEAARTVRQRAPVTLTLVRQRAQPTAESIVRLTVTAVFAYLLALLIPSTPRPVLAPLTALLVVQVSAYQTLRSAVRRVASVVAGVLLALGLSAWVGFTWWSLGIAIAIGLAVGHALHLREEVLEVPISAMLILSVGTRSAATGRVVETAIGTAAGLAAGFVLTSPRVQPAEEAVEELCRTLAGLLERVAAGLGSGSVKDSARDCLAQARSLGNEIRRVDDALRAAEESTKLNLRSLRLPYSTITLRESLETLEHEAVTLRVFTRSLVDSTRLDGDDNPLSDPDVRRNMAGVLRELAAAVRTYGSLATEFDEANHDLLESELERHLAAAHDEQYRLSELLGRDRVARPVAWPLRGELVSQLDRLRAELEAGKPYRRVRRRRNHGWRLPHPGRQRLLPSWRRIMK